MTLRQTPQVSRRTFVRRGALASATAWSACQALGPTIIPRRVLASDAAPGANEQIQIGIIGMGVRGRQLVMNVPAAARVTAICDADTRKTADATRRFGADWAVYQDYRRLLDRRDLDAVMIATCDHHHVQASILACQAGKDIYVEKPLSIYVREGRALVDAVRKHDRVGQTGTQQRTMEINRFACEFVRDGGIGRIHAIECVNFRGPREIPEDLPAETVPTELDWDLWQGPAREQNYNQQLAAHWSDKVGNWWGTWRDYSVSQLTGLGSHAFDMVQYATGMDASGPVELWPVEQGPDARVHFRYANGIEVRLRFPDGEPQRGPRLGAIFVGSDCKIEINRNKYTTNPPDFIQHGPDPAVAKKWEGDGWVAKGHVENWCDCIVTRELPNADVEIGHRTATLCQLLDITRRLGRRLQWDPREEQFVGDPQANQLLDRPRRAGWGLPDLT